MFSLLGNLIFGVQDEAEELQTQEQIVSIQSNDASTQTLEMQQQQQQSQHLPQSNNINNQGNETVKSNDWILIDRSDNSCKYKSNSFVDNSVNTSIMMLDEQQNDFNVNKNSNDQLFGNNNKNMGTNTISYAKIVKANLKIEEDEEEEQKQQEKVEEEEVEEEEVNEKIVYTCATREQAMKANKMMIASNDSECLLGSFFERHTDEIEMQDDEEKEVEETNEVEELMQSNKKEDWLITPLPCLTSITCSQRSIIENHPLENLLIEHPSMSVFVTATSTSSCDEDEEMRQIEENKEDLIEQQYHKPIVVAAPASTTGKSAQQKKKSNKKQEDSLAKEVKTICSTRQIIQKAVAEKRNALQNIQFALNIEAAANLNKNSLPRSSIAKKSKKIKKSLSPVNIINNKNVVEIQDKENASQFLFVNNNNNSNNGSSSSSLNNSKQISNSNVQNKLSVNNNNKKKSEVSKMKKSQLNRVNKINTFSSGKNHSNKQQRKFHKLQQPAASFASSGSQF